MCFFHRGAGEGRLQRWLQRAESPVLEDTKERIKKLGDIVPEMHSFKVSAHSEGWYLLIAAAGCLCARSLRLSDVLE